MTKRELIDEIITINHTAEPAFLAKFGDADLSQYLDHLLESRRRRAVQPGPQWRRSTSFEPKLEVQVAIDEAVVAVQPAQPVAQAEPDAPTAEEVAALNAAPVAAAKPQHSQPHASKGTGDVEEMFLYG